MPDLFTVPTPFSGRLAVVERPRGGDWLHDDMRRLRAAGVDTLVSALVKDEMRTTWLEAEPDLAAAAGIRFVHLPISNLGTPLMETEADTLRVLDLKPTGTDTFQAVTEQEQGRLFGGLVLAQAVIAAGRTVEAGTIHSMHGYFLRAGRPAKPIDYRVARIRDGRNFTGRRVTACQDGDDIIFEASLSFTQPEAGVAYQRPMPAETVGPEGQPEWWQTLGAAPDQQRERLPRRWANPIEIVNGEEGGSKRPLEERLPRRLVWGRPAGAMPEDPLFHAAAIAYFSDSGMIATVASVLGMWQPGGATASLDHSIWWHLPPRFDDWLLYETESPVANAARGLIWGGMYTRKGERVVSVAQEGLFRKPS